MYFKMDLNCDFLCSAAMKPHKVLPHGNIEAECLSYCSIVIERHHNQGNLQNETFNWGLAYSFRVLVRDHGGKQTDTESFIF